MRIIINEEQLRLIVENEDKDNLINFTPIYGSGFPPEIWDEMFLSMKEKKKFESYIGYYINGDVDLLESNVTKLDYLVKVFGWLDLRSSKIESLFMLEYVKDGLSVHDTPLSDKTTEKELNKQIKVGWKFGGIYL